MAKTSSTNPHSNAESPQSNGGQAGSRWVELRKVGAKMLALSSRLAYSEKQHSVLQSRDVTEMLELAYQIIYVSSLFGGNPSDVGPEFAAPVPGKKRKLLPEKRKRSPEACKRRKRTPADESSKVNLDGTEFPTDTMLTRDNQRVDSASFPPLLDGIDPTLQNDFVGLFGNAQLESPNATSAATDEMDLGAATDEVDFGGIPCPGTTSSTTDLEEIDTMLYNEFLSSGDFIDSIDIAPPNNLTNSTTNRLPSRPRHGMKQDKKQGKKQGKHKEAGGMRKTVAHTFPRVTLKSFLEDHDGDRICLCGRGAHNHHHEGNQRFIKIIQTRKSKYLSLSKKAKEQFTTSLTIDLENSLHFYKVNKDDEWEKMDRGAVRAKVSQSFRDAKTLQGK